MAKDIIKELLAKYKLDTSEETVKALEQMIQLGFDAKWLRNIQIIKDFDVLYKINTPTMRIYSNLGIKYHTSSDHVRRIVSDRSLYEI
jgi:hypothetical protein